jgi:YVTN family beta-propeller protein
LAQEIVFFEFLIYNTIIDILDYLLVNLQHPLQNMKLKQAVMAVVKEAKMAHITSQGTVVVTKKRTKEVIIEVPDHVSHLEVLSLNRSYAIEETEGGTGVLVSDTQTRRAVAQITVMKKKILLEQSSMAVTSDGAFIYVLNHVDQTVSIINTETNRVTDTIPVRREGEAAQSGVKKGIRKKGVIAVIVAALVIVVAVVVVVTVTLLKPASLLQRISVAYVTNAGIGLSYGQNVSVIDTEKGIVIATIQVGAMPVAVAFAPDGAQAYVANQADGTVSVIDTATDQVVAYATVDSGSGPVIILFTPNGTQAYVVNENSPTLFVIDRVTNRVTSIQVGQFSNDIAVTPGGTKVYVTNGDVNAVSVIDTAVNQVTATISVGRSPGKVSITLDGTKAYVVNEADNTISVIDTASDQVITNISIGIAPVDIAMNPNGTQAYVVNSGISNLDSSVVIIDTITDQVIYEITFAYASPFQITVTPDGTKAYVTTNSATNDYFYYIDLEVNTYFAILDEGEAIAIAITPDGTRACVVNHGSNSVTLFHTVSYEEAIIIPVKGSGPVGIATAVIDHH